MQAASQQGKAGREGCDASSVATGQSKARGLRCKQRRNRAQGARAAMQAASQQGARALAAHSEAPRNGCAAGQGGGLEPRGRVLQDRHVLLQHVRDDCDERRRHLPAPGWRGKGA